MGRRNPLHLLRSAERVLDIFQTEAQEQVTEDGLLNLTFKPCEGVILYKRSGDAFYGRRLSTLPRGPCGRAKSFQKCPSTSALAVAEHIEHGRENGG